MATQSEAGEDEKIPQSPANLGEWVVDRYRKVKEDVETYPYVWASYGMVYGGFALWTAYRWRKLRKTEDRVRGLQERLRKLVESEERSKSVHPTIEAPPK